MSRITAVSTLEEMFGIEALIVIDSNTDQCLRATIDGDGDLWISQRDFGGDGDEVILSPKEARELRDFLNHNYLGDTP